MSWKRSKGIQRESVCVVMASVVDAKAMTVLLQDPRTDHGQAVGSPDSPVDGAETGRRAAPETVVRITVAARA